MQKSSIQYNPDVLSCLASLSSDEVFTPPDIANQMLDMLPQDLFCSPHSTFLDPASKTGVFLREIAKRLLKGLETQIPDLQQRIDHILTKQLFGIGITELTALLTRRSLYCSRHANGEFSITQLFDDEQGNIRYQPLQHQWENGKCCQCGASQKANERDGNLESHAYAFIHQPINEIFGNGNLPVKFDVIIGNPPYQLSDGGAQASAMPIYQHFVEQAKKLNPTYISMIIPSRWYAGGKGLDSFRDAMLNDKDLVELHDFPIAAECFNGIKLEGGICYFLLKKGHQKECLVVTHENGQITSTAPRYLKEEGLDIFIRYNQAMPILHKVKAFKESSFSEFVSARKPFGLTTNFKGNSKPYKDPFNNVVLYENKKTSYVKKQDIPIKREWIDSHKVYISYAYGMGNKEPYQVINKAFYGKPNSACTETYLLIGPFHNKETCENVVTYLSTRFVRFLILLIKNTQHATKKVYEFVPIQDFSEPWTDEKLYAKYQLTPQEIDYIEKMVQPMD